jgi:hypothetical protein
MDIMTLGASRKSLNTTTRLTMTSIPMTTQGFDIYKDKKFAQRVEVYILYSGKYFRSYSVVVT